MKRTVVFALMCLIGAAATEACSSSGGATSGDPGDAAVATDGPAAETAPPTDSGDAEAAKSCTLGAPPAPLPAVTGKLLIEGQDAATAPAATGGEETGLWAYTAITVYLPPLAAGQVDPDASSITGTGWIRLGGGRFEQFVDTTTTLSTATLGKVVRATASKVLGTYTKAATAVTFVVECRETSGEAGSLGDAGFSRIDATHARLHIVTTSQLGTSKLVIDLEKRP